ncbi:MAG: diacylglycerol kinase [Gammaproteobacteria bacterium]|uniref:Diacylglycerol kinase n=1 Tax=OM182 bacterium MED-G24 TaxID=1986255 RepID=A0A2A5WNB4_9GAMM|nr:diacylglycerol kinase [Gammaproteobacteria bacterium]PDH38030.1 MAG: diacylglycerol kinase [OM182 bacterium MED-G24]RPG26450.1 MAG: diacylglycerol kinase [Gammaproteobacteria bacterium TMED50]
MENQSQKLADAEPHFDKRSNTGLRHLVNAARFSIRGISSAWVRESAFRQEVILLIVLLPVAYVISNTVLEIIALVVVALLVLIVELLNSAVEAIVDRVGLEHNELAGLAKDYGSAAVMISLCAAALTWGYMVLRFFGMID